MDCSRVKLVNTWVNWANISVKSENMSDLLDCTWVMSGYSLGSWVNSPGLLGYSLGSWANSSGSSVNISGCLGYSLGSAVNAQDSWVSTAVS